MYRLGFGCNRCGDLGNLCRVGIDPLQTRGLGNLGQVLHWQGVAVNLRQGLSGGWGGGYGGWCHYNGCFDRLGLCCRCWSRNWCWSHSCYSGYRRCGQRRRLCSCCVGYKLRRKLGSISFGIGRWLARLKVVACSLRRAAFAVVSITAFAAFAAITVAAAAWWALIGAYFCVWTVSFTAIGKGCVIELSRNVTGWWRCLRIKCQVLLSTVFFNTALVATTATLTTAFRTTFTATIAALGTLALSGFLVGAILGCAFLALLFRVTGSGHGGLIGQCQVLLYWIASNAVCALWTFAATTTAFCAGFTWLTATFCAGLAWFTRFAATFCARLAWFTWFASLLVAR